MRWCALQANTNPAGVAFTQFSSVDADGRLPERVVDLHRVQPRRVVLQEILLRELGGIKIRLPARVGEAGGSGEDAGHVTNQCSAGYH